jgi:hypothetical protein
VSPAPTITNMKYISMKIGWPVVHTMAPPTTKISAARASGM